MGETEAMEMKTEGHDYFNYLLEISNIDQSVELYSCNTNTDCGDSGYFTKCCSKSVMRDPTMGTKDVQYRCMNRGLVEGSFEMQMGDYSVEFSCMGSGAAKLMGTAVLMATAASLF